MFLALSARAQVFKEDFNSGTALNSWILLDIDGRTPASPVSRFTSAWVLSLDSSTADSCASSTSWYNPLGQADDWMISPAITLTANNILSWEAEAVDNRYPDGYEVRISTTTADTAGFFAQPPLLVVPAENPFWTQRSINLAANGYANQNVYLAWRNNSDDEYILNVDNIEVNAISGSNAKMLTAIDIVDEYYQVPFSQADTFSLLGVVENIGADTLFNLKAICEIYRNGNLAYTDSTLSLPFLAPSDTAILVNPQGYRPSIEGDYYVRYYPRYSGIDSDSSDNFYITDTLVISDTTFSRDNGLQISSVGIGSGVRGELGCTYSLLRPDTLSSVSIYIANTGGQMNGQDLSINLRSFASAPSTIIASSDTITYTSNGGSWVNFSFDRVGGSVPLPSGRYFIGVVEPDSNLTLGTTNRIYTNGVNYIRFTGGITNGWNTLDAYSIRTTLMIRPHFAANNLLVDVSTSTQSEKTFSIYPNPSMDGIFNIRSSSVRGELTNCRLFNMSGKEVTSFRLNNNFYQLDLSGQSKGLYFLEIRNGDQIELKKLIYP